jgi:hypothetical protein
MCIDLPCVLLTDSRPSGMSPILVPVCPHLTTPVAVTPQLLRPYGRNGTVALGHAIESSTAHTYNSHLQSNLTFCKIHQLSIEATPDTLSFYVVFMAHHQTSLSLRVSLWNLQLPRVLFSTRATRTSLFKFIVTKSLTGMHERGSRPITRKRALTEDDLRELAARFPNPPHDDCLFLAMVFTGFNRLLRSGEMTRPSNPSLQSGKKFTLRHTVHLQQTQYSFHLPYHQGDRLYPGNTIIIHHRIDTTLSLLPYFRTYLISRDLRFPLHPELWLNAQGIVPLLHMVCLTSASHIRVKRRWTLY